jgi:hypothetical protein
MTDLIASSDVLSVPNDNDNDEHDNDIDGNALDSAGSVRGTNKLIVILPTR